MGRGTGYQPLRVADPEWGEREQPPVAVLERQRQEPIRPVPSASINRPNPPHSPEPVEGSRRSSQATTNSFGYQENGYSAIRGKEASV